ncbi:MAG: YbaB/EbfC family nucleoid-associated protein [Anaerolineae bacterium]|nr:YbaB/EbfC family nucleoid-associated protein [Anaerolineae bacterium]
MSKKKAFNLVGQLQKIQEEMLKAQERLAEETIEVTAGGGVIKVVIDGHQRVRSITLSPEVVNPEDIEMLQDLILVAINEAIERSQALVAERLSSIVGGTRITGLKI